MPPDFIEVFTWFFFKSLVIVLKWMVINFGPTLTLYLLMVSPAASFIHELSHAWMAKLFDWKVDGIDVGRSRFIFSFNYHKMLIRIGVPPIGGCCHHKKRKGNAPHHLLEDILVSLAGAAGMILLTLLVSLGVYGYAYISGLSLPLWTHLLFLWVTITELIQLIPYKSNRVITDGRQILDLYRAYCVSEHPPR